MARELIVAWAGRGRDEDWEPLCGRFRDRIGHMVPVRELAVRSRGGAGSPDRLEREGRDLLAALPEPCWTVALDRRGRARSSRGLARWLKALLERWPHPVAFLIGSDLGLATAAREAAREVLSLGPLTLPHALARLVLYEQLYRALCIQRGIKYHRPSL